MIISYNYSYIIPDLKSGDVFLIIGTCWLNPYTSTLSTNTVVFKVDLLQLLGLQFYRQDLSILEGPINQVTQGASQL